MKRERLRLPVWILTIILTLTMTPMGAFAETAEVSEGTDATGFVAEESQNKEAPADQTEAAQTADFQTVDLQLTEAAGSTDEADTILVMGIFDKKNYKISFDSNLGWFTYADNMPDDEKVQKNGSYTIPENVPTYSGKVFTGWNTKSNGKGDSYQPGDTISKVKNNTTLYAQWRNAYRISYDDNIYGWLSAGNVPSIGYASADGTYTIPSNVPRLEGYVFTGWNTDREGNGTAYQPGDTIENIEGDLELFGQWEETCDINFHDNLTLLGIFELADNMPDDDTVIKGETYTIPSNIPTFEGLFHSYALTSWNTDSWGHGTEYKPGDKIENVTGNINLYAQWREVTMAEHLDVRIANKSVLDNISRVVATINGVDYDTYLERDWDGNLPEFRTDIDWHIPVTASVQFTVYFKDGTPAYKTDVFGEEENSAAYNRCYDEHPWQFDWGMDYVITAEDMTDPADPTPTDPADPTPNNPSDPEDPTPNNPTDPTEPTPSEPAEPVYSSYTVEYYFQNADDEGYTNDKSVTLTVDDIEVGTEINTDTEGVKQSFENFTFNPAVSSSVLTGTVSETEDTVLKLYYDRNTFKVNYAYGQGAPENATDLTGDAYREATYKYGQTVTVAPAASAEYYDFSGWKCEGLKIENGTFTMPAKAVTLTGMFARQTASYKVEYYLQNANDNGYTQDTEATLTAKVDAGTTISLETKDVKKSFENFTLNTAAVGTVSEKTTTASETVVLKLYYDRNTFKVNYAYGQGAPATATDLTGEAYREATYKYGQTVTVAPAASAEYYDFSGWKCEGLKIENGTFTMPAKAVTFTGSFTKKKASYTVQYYLENADDEGFTLAQGETETVNGVDVETVIDTKTNGVLKTFPHYSFYADATGSELSGEVVAASEEQPQGLVLKLYYNRNRSKVSYTFGENAPEGVSALPESFEGKYGQTIKLPEAATAPGHTFKCWNVITAEDETESVEAQAVETAEDGTFIMPDGQVTIFGEFTVNSYEVKYVDGVDGAAFAEQSKTAEYGTETPKFDGTPARTGYTFEGWTPEVAEKVSEDAVYTATWKLIPAEDNSNSGRDGGRTSGGNGVTTITDDQVPLAEMPELNTKDHTAYVLGYEDGTVKPENKITRAEVATIFFRLLTEDSRVKILSTVNSFSDASAADWFNEAVSTLSNGGVINGYTDGTFKPSGNITRAEFATIAARFDSSAVDTSAIRFTDISGHWAEASIKKAAALGYINGYEDGSFRPDAAISRAEAMALLNRVLGRDKITAEGLLADQMTTFSDNPVTAWYYTAVQEATNSHDHVMENGAEAWTAIK